MGNLDLLSYEALLEESFPLEISDKPQSAPQRGLESETATQKSIILDGITGWIAWSAMLIMVVGALVNPVFVFTISAIVGMYMAGRFLMAGILALRGMILIKEAQKIDWQAKYHQHHHPDNLAWGDVLHVMIIPNYKEDYKVLYDTLARIAESPIAKTQVCVVLAMEEREKDALAKSESLTVAFESRFLHMMTTFHPKDIPGEVPGKSSNEAWAGREAYKALVLGHGYDIDNMVITIMDADSLIHPRYLEAVTYHFATAPKDIRYNRMWQAPIRYDNNIWKVHPFFTYLHAYSTAWYLSGLMGRKPMPLSTYSLSFRLAHDAGYWDTDVIPEDWHMYIKCYFKRKGNMDLQPILLPFSGYSAAVGDTFIDAFRSQYNQSVRHMWGAEDVGYIIEQSTQNQKMPLLPKLSIFWHVLHNHALSTTGWIMTNLGVQLALILHPQYISTGIVSYQINLLQAIIHIIILTSFLFWVMDMRMRPPKDSWRLDEILITAISFVIMPFTTVILTILPALEAQTRLMLGIPIHYRVARKV